MELEFVCICPPATRSQAERSQSVSETASQQGTLKGASKHGSTVDIDNPATIPEEGAASQPDQSTCESQTSGRLVKATVGACLLVCYVELAAVLVCRCHHGFLLTLPVLL